MMAKHGESTQKGGNRRRALLEAAARLFGRRGYDGTSIREIAALVGMLPGSVYYHFPSKEALLLAVHEEGVVQVLESVRQAIEECPDGRPWARLKAAAAAHLETLLSEVTFSQVVTPYFTQNVDEPLRAELIAQRDEYEMIFVSLIADLNLPSECDRRLLRLAMLGSLNWVTMWYRRGGDSPTDIAHKIVELYRARLDCDAEQ